MTKGDPELMFPSLKKTVIKRSMSAEMSQHLGYGPEEGKPRAHANQRNGKCSRASPSHYG